jgi:hypothetical protein
LNHESISIHPTQSLNAVFDVQVYGGTTTSHDERSFKSNISQENDHLDVPMAGVRVVVVVTVGRDN